MKAMAMQKTSESALSLLMVGNFTKCGALENIGSADGLEWGCVWGIVFISQINKEMG